MPFFTVIVPSMWQWVPGKIRDFQSWRPVIRSAVAVWVAFVFLLIRPIAQSMGNAAYFILIVPFFLPPSDAFFAYLDKMVTLLFVVGSGWLWSVCASAAADSVRRQPSAARLDYFREKYATNVEPQHLELYLAYSGAYLDVRSSAVYCAFLFIAVVALAYIRAHNLARYQLPAVLGYILLDITHVYGALVPGFNNGALIGKVFFLPAVIWAAIGLFATLTIFPETTSYKFCSTLIRATDALSDARKVRQQLLQSDIMSDEFQTLYAKLQLQRTSASPIFVAMKQLRKNLTREISCSRFTADHLLEMEQQLRRVLITSSGMAILPSFIAKWNTRVKAMPVAKAKQRKEQPDTLEAVSDSRRQSFVNLLHLVTTQEPVGQYENNVRSKMDVELSREQHTTLLREAMSALEMACRPLDAAVGEVLTKSSAFLRSTNEQRLWLRFGMKRTSNDLFWSLFRRKLEHHDIVTIEDVQTAADDLKQALRHFQLESRQSILHSLKDAVTSTFGDFHDIQHLVEDPSARHRAVHYSLLYCFQSVEFAERILGMVDVLKITKSRIEFSGPSLLKMLRQRFTKAKPDEKGSADIDTFVDEEGLAESARRNPDAWESSNAFQLILRLLGRLFHALSHGFLFYGIRLGILTVLLAIPFLADSTAHFFYFNRAIWALIIAQLCFQRWMGDTTLQFLFRTIASLIGVALGCACWYIGSGNGRGNPYGLAAIFAVTCPIILFYRINAPPSLTVPAIVLASSVGQIIGYSWIDAQGLGSLADPGSGWSVSWRRFVAIVAGITCAWIWSFLPQPESNRRRVRKTLAETSETLADVYLELATYATHSHRQPDAAIEKRLLAVNSILRVFCNQRFAGAPYEFKTGKWPEAVYRDLQRLQLELSDTLGQLMLVYFRIDQEHRNRLTQKTRFLSHDFVGEISSVFWLIGSALASGKALPQITPCPLVGRAYSSFFSLPRLSKTHGTSISRPIDFAELESESYMVYSAGVTLTFALLSRLDEMMLIVKELVGETHRLRDVVHALHPQKEQ